MKLREDKYFVIHLCMNQEAYFETSCILACLKGRLDAIARLGRKGGERNDKLSFGHFEFEAYSFSLRYHLLDYSLTF